MWTHYELVRVGPGWCRTCHDLSLNSAIQFYIMHKNLTIACFCPPHPLSYCSFLLYIPLTSQCISIIFTFGRWCILYFPIHLLFFMSITPLCKCRFSPCMISLLPEKFSLTFFIIQHCWWWILLAFFL